MDIEESVEFQKQYIQKIIDACGPRLPGSEEERKGANLIAEDFQKLTGNVHIDEFPMHPMAFIGWIPIVGILLFVAAVFVLFAPWVTAIFIVIGLMFAVIQFIKYMEVFDFLFPKAISQNVYSIVEPASGIPRYTIVLSGHMDSSMGWNLAEHSSEKLRYKLFYGFGSVFLLLTIAVLRIIESFVGDGLGSGVPLTWLFYFIPILLPGFLYIARFLSWDKKNASPGAMDNLAGIAESISIVKYFKDHPEDTPKDCRILLVGFGSEEAGLRGSRAFVKRHKNDLLAGDVWVINIDGVSDVEYFNLLKGEMMLAVNYNKDFVNIVANCMREFKLDRPFWKLDIGASDAVSFCRIKKKAFTFSAQDNAPRNNYHTRFDLVKNINPEALRKMMILVLRVIEKIDIYVTSYQPEWLVDYLEQDSFLYKLKEKLKNKRMVF